MKGWLTVLLLLAATALRAAPDPRRALAEGEQAFHQTNMTEAARQFAAAAEQAAGSGLDPAVATYNHGLALLADGQAQAAAGQFEAATRTPDLELQQQAMFNRGNALCQVAADLEKQSQLEPALQAIQGAQAMYEKVLLLNPDERDAKVNYELAGRARERIEQMIQQQPPDNQGKNEEQQDQEKETEKENQDQQEHPEGQQQPDQADQGDSPRPEDQPQAGGPEREQAAEEQQPASSQEMTREEATRLLDGMKEQEQANREQMARDRMRLNMGRLPAVDKDW